jgi:hypothetical protein
MHMAFVFVPLETMIGKALIENVRTTKPTTLKAWFTMIIA